MAIGPLSVGLKPPEVTVPIGAPDRWDYLVYDAPTHRLYVSHGDRLTVLGGRLAEPSRT